MVNLATSRKHGEIPRCSKREREGKIAGDEFLLLIEKRSTGLG